MNGISMIFSQRLSEALESDYPRVDEVVEAYLDMRDANKEQIIASLKSGNNIPSVHENLILKQNLKK